ncbi:MFS transporter [Haloechinothrix halophila]|uniref:MFS transporter n=1 Tax=Haloechinothrix halophila TaxID=1069073 RepID=UPI0003F891FE|nr:MFS transporter [Haloechinothrix halophila]
MVNVPENGRRSDPAPSTVLTEAGSRPRQLHEQARQSLGFTGSHDAPPLRKVFREHKVGWYPISALGMLAIVDQFQSYVFTVLTPDMARSLGLSLAAIVGMRTLQALAHALSPLPMAALTQNRAWRAGLSIITAFGWSLITAGTGLVVSLWGLAIVLVADGLLVGSAVALHRPLIMDIYPPSARVRLLAIREAFERSTSIAAPLLVAVFAGIFDLTWRGVFLALGGVSIIGAVFALGLRDPGYGKWDTQRIREAVHESDHSDGATGLPSKDVQLGFFEIMRRLMLIPTVRRLAFGYLVFGILVIPYTTFLSFYLDDRWGMDAAERGIFFAFTAAVGVVALIAYGPRGEAIFRENPGRVLDVAGIALVAAVICILTASLMPWFLLMVLLFSAAQALIGLLSPLLGIAQLSVVEAAWRPHAASLIGVFMASGSLAGVFLLTGVEERYGVLGAMISLMVPGVVGALIIRSAKDLVAKDLGRLIVDIVEDEEVRRTIASGGHLPLLACRKVDFSYGQLQVLFGVDFTVDDGEMVALLGTNGAGKSTLLKAISGIALPCSGTVRFRGQDVTYLDAERRVKLGISQIPGGHAVFGTMNVVENLRAYGYTLGRDRKAIDAAIDRSFEAFPRLHERRNSQASTLSGGEQQMLGLSKALILRPRLLLIDELSLGLAPVIVGQLLELVRKINAQGTAVVLVEQSVNVALSVARHAYFMEKGEIRFDGPSDELLARGDLLRAVFLEGATKGTGQ